MIQVHGDTENCILYRFIGRYREIHANNLKEFRLTTNDGDHCLYCIFAFVIITMCRYLMY